MKPVPSTWRYEHKNKLGVTLYIYSTRLDPADGTDYVPMYTSGELNQYGQACFEEGRDARAMVEPMTEVADRFAHRLALELECVLADRGVNWNRAITLIGEYRSEMNAIHEQHSPTRFGEPVLSPIAQPTQPAKQQSQPTNMAPCEVLRNHGKCWRNACVVAGACTAPPVQATKP